MADCGVKSLQPRNVAELVQGSPLTIMKGGTNGWRDRPQGSGVLVFVILVSSWFFLRSSPHGANVAAAQFYPVLSTSSTTVQEKEAVLFRRLCSVDCSYRYMRAVKTNPWFAGALFVEAALLHLACSAHFPFPYH